MQTIEDIIAKAGGPKALVAEALRQGQKMHAQTPRDWIDRKTIPEKRWSVVRALCNVSVAKLHRLNEAARANGRTAR